MEEASIQNDYKEYLFIKQEKTSLSLYLFYLMVMLACMQYFFNKCYENLGGRIANGELETPESSF